MTERKRKHLGRKLFTVLVLALLVLLSLANLDLLSVPLERFFHRDISFETFAGELQGGYTSDDFVGKNSFVNLNGMFSRLTGQRMLNNTVKLNNGMLSMTIEDRDMSGLESSIIGLSDYLREQGTPFLYVQLPYKESMDGQSFPVGLPSYGNSIADRMLSRFQAEGVDTLDLRPMLSRTQEMLELYFQKTDHHWNVDGAFVAFREILGRLDEMFPGADIDLTVAREDRWERHSVDNWSLGSWGKRVGLYFGGTDPLTWLTPGFETEMSCAIPKYGWLYRGDFTTANVRGGYAEKRDYFNDSTYCIYIGGDFPLVMHRNACAASPLKVMILKDSFSLPLQALLSTAVQEIDVVDPRLFKECSVAEYVELTKPDVVIMAINPDWPGEEMDFGVDTAVAVSGEEGAFELVTRQDITIEASDSIYHYLSLPLEAGTVYRVSFDGVEILEGETEGVGLRVYDLTEEEVLQNTVLDLAYCAAADGFRWMFRTPCTEDALELLFYAGAYGDTAGNGVVYRNVTLEKMPAGG